MNHEIFLQILCSAALLLAVAHVVLLLPMIRKARWDHYRGRRSSGPRYMWFEVVILVAICVALVCAALSFDLF